MRKRYNRYWEIYLIVTVEAEEVLCLISAYLNHLITTLTLITLIITLTNRKIGTTFKRCSLYLVTINMQSPFYMILLTECSLEFINHAHVMSLMPRELSPLECRVSHSTQATRYTYACRNRLFFAKRQRVFFRLFVGCANIQWTSGNLSPVPQGSG